MFVIIMKNLFIMTLPNQKKFRHSAPHRYKLKKLVQIRDRMTSGQLLFATYAIVFLLAAILKITTM